MRVLFCSSEIYPYAKTGGLADFSFCLIKYLKKYGVKVKGVMPYYKTLKAENLRKTDKGVTLNLNGKDYTFEVYESEDCYFLRNDELFGRDYIYGPPGWGYEDNDIRFGGFSRAVSELISTGQLEADVVHANDWQTALIPLFLKEVFKTPVKTVFTIHNLAYQGLFPKETVERVGIPPYLFHMEAVEFWGLVNFMKGGIVFSDLITTVSPTYAKEIQTQEYGYGLEGVLKKYSYKLRGILNGIDYEVWNPEKDKYIYQNYSLRNYSKKFKNKEFLSKELGIEAEKPLISFINRFTHQKGVELILNCAEEMSKLNANFVFLGTGEYENAFLDVSKIYKNFKVFAEFNEGFARKLYASSDFILMPSYFEPCGLTQMIGMRYGCVPIVRKTGGLRDTVKDISEGGYGITFEEPSKETFLCSLKRAIELYENAKKFRNSVKIVMSLDFSCDRMTKEYIECYEEVQSHQ
ncbi:glycogen synthase [Aquifex aeolicus]|uniref:Glycogen synthase n=1 Tax=Aquifex aeolicus (strain VF5) TaxID=224324 RepID=GLGA_AQUAE|nr:glycogen synthase [Aquifex aeolicus]O66935.1 RecName: Full=Glycogen synthase; AltName: Full=Starch [bacterial glycogen] synthase [Aquifex aeolicus VF5]AAC06894.1 glycogen synthase [Aquifex aeolicus VF5]